MTTTFTIDTTSGAIEVECFWRNDVLAVTRDIGRLLPDDTLIDPVDAGWVLTHIPTRRCMGISSAERARDPDGLRALAEHLTPVVPWATLSLEELTTNPEVHRKVVVAARVFWESRRSEEG